MDAKDISAIKKLRPYFHVIFFDISGNRELQTVLPLLDSYEKALKPELIVIKNFKLRRLLNQTFSYEDYEYVNSLRNNSTTTDTKS